MTELAPIRSIAPHLDADTLPQQHRPDPSPDLAPHDAPTRTIASVPSAHVYVRHVAAERPDGVVRLPDPDPDSPERSTEQRWWPPVMLSPEWVSTHAFDVFHVQFGFDAWSPEDLRDVLDAVHAQGRPVVYTAHDLRNPHHTDRTLHDAQLAVLLELADEVLTLTEGAADELQRRWGRTPLVVPHPHVVDLATMGRLHAERRRAPQERFRIGLHLKSLRASMAPTTILPTLVRTARELDAVLQVNGHRDVLEGASVRSDPALNAYLREAERRGDLELHVHDFLSDEDLWAYLTSLDVSVLPYRFGTHSGWLEACRDLGTAVVAPTCGHYADQGPVHAYRLDEHGFDARSLEVALRDAQDAGPTAPVSVSWRREQRAEIAATHRAVYEAVT